MAGVTLVCLLLVVVPFSTDSIGHLREVNFMEVQTLTDTSGAAHLAPSNGSKAPLADDAYTRGFRNGFETARTFVQALVSDPCVGDGCGEDGNGPWHSDIFSHPRPRANGTAGGIPIGFGLLRDTPARDWVILLIAVLVCMALDSFVLQAVCKRYSRGGGAADDRLREAFQSADVSGSGYITEADLSEVWEKSPDVAALAAARAPGARGCSKEGGPREGAAISWEEFREMHPIADKRATMLRSTTMNLFTLAFWVLMAGVFNVVIWKMRGWETGVQWCSGYLLEWLLSLDNLFVFHLIFQAYATPRPLLHKALFVGIVGAVVFRMFFFLAVSSLLHLVHWMRYIFGALLIYSGIQAARDDDDEPDIQNNIAVRMLKGCLGSRLSQTYDLKGQRLFVTGSDGRLCATLLVPVIFCLEATDILFALDSVSAKLAQIPDYYIAYSSSVMAIFGLRAMFFLVQDIVDYFELMKYGLCFILVFIGIELIFAEYVKLPAQVVLVVVIAVFVVCAAGSTVQQFCRSKARDGPAAEHSPGHPADQAAGRA